MKRAFTRAKETIVGIAALALAGAPAAFAQTGSTQVTLVNPLGTTDFPTILNNVIHFLAQDIAIPLTTIMVLVGAFQLMTSAGNPEKESKGKKTIAYAAIGFGVALLATGITSIISSVLNGTG